MVFFTCNHCGESVKKNRVEKHYQTICRRNPVAISCIDCCKDFSAKTYPEHNTCITEQEKYSAKGFKAKPVAQKQNKWNEVVQLVCDKFAKTLSREESIVLDTIRNEDNVPRKKKKFQNYMKSKLNRRFNEEACNSVFDKIEAESKKGVEDNQKPQQEENESMEQEEEEKENSVEQEIDREQNKKLSKKERKESRKRAKYEAELKQLESNDATENGVEEEEERLLKKKKKKSNEEVNDTTENGVVEEEAQKKKSKKNKKTNEEEDEVNGVDDEVAAPKTKFNWQEVIVQALSSREEKEMPLKRLKKKVLQEYEASSGSSADEKIIAKFNKKVQHTPGVVVLRDTAKLVPVH